MLYFKKAISALVLGAFSIGAQAATYTYIGNSLTNTFSADNPAIAGQFDSSNKITITLETANPLATSADNAFAPVHGNSVVSFTISDGRNTLNQTNSYLTTKSLKTDAAGNIVEWLIIASSGNEYPEDIPPVDLLSGDSLLRMSSENWSAFPLPVADRTHIYECQVVALSGCPNVPLAGHLAEGEGTNNLNSPGVWTASAVPLPAAAWLFLSGLGGAGLMRRVARKA